MTCEICERIKNKQNIVYEEKNVIIFVPKEAIIQGHLVIVPKQHFPIMESIPDEIIEEMYFVANKAGIALFEALGIQGTNLLIQNGTAAGQEHPHVMLNIIPRKENDEINLQWTPKQMNEEEMATLELQIKEQLEKKETEMDIDEDIEEKNISDSEEKKLEKKEESPKIKILTRIP